MRDPKEVEPTFYNLFTTASFWVWQFSILQDLLLGIVATDLCHLWLLAPAVVYVCTSSGVCLVVQHCTDLFGSTTGLLTTLH